MSNQSPFGQIYSFGVSVEVTDEGTFAVDHSTGKKFPCCPTCHEPYMLENNDRGCMNSTCPNYIKENWAYWKTENGNYVLIQPEV
jgi:hypothetical protein